MSHKITKKWYAHIYSTASTVTFDLFQAVLSKNMKFDGFDAKQQWETILGITNDGLQGSSCSMKQNSNLFMVLCHE